MRRPLMTLLALAAGWTFAAAAHAQNVTITPQPASPVDERTRVGFLVDVTPGAPAGERSYRMEIRPEGGGALVRGEPSANPEDFQPRASFGWEAVPPGTYMVVVIVRFGSGPAASTQSASLRNFVVRPMPNPYHLVAEPASGATANSAITLRAQPPSGQSLPAGLHCLFEAIPPAGAPVGLSSPQCTPVQMRLGAGTWTLRLIVHRGTNPRAAPTLAETVGRSQIGGYTVAAAAGGTAAPGCPSQCEARAGACVRPRENVMPCLAGGKCPLGYSCTTGFCRQTVSSGPVIACGQGGRCPPGLTCRSGQCRAPAPTAQTFTCTTNVDCANGWVCASGECRRTCP
jgi:hypothetical protein